MKKVFTDNKKRQNRRKGFSLMEMLAVIAIIAILCGIVFVAIGTIAKNMRFKERNDYAKTIFMAAQANLTAMQNNGELGKFHAEDVNHIAMTKELQAKVGFPGDEGFDQYVYTSSELPDTTAEKDSYGLVLPVNSVETHIRDKKVIIEYNPVTGNVYSVFYSENEESLLSMYRNGKLPRDVDARRELEIGYYCGTMLSGSSINLDGVEVDVEYVNDQEGYLSINVTLPDSISSPDTFAKGLDVTLTLTGETSNAEKKVQIMSTTGADIATWKQNNDVLQITYVLDSLADGKSFANFAAGDYAGTKHLSAFKDESAFTNTTGFIPGENLMVYTEVTYTGSGVSQKLGANNQIINPMFQKLIETLGKTILEVSNGRNLQNLNALAPQIAASVDEVVFVKDIDWNETVNYYNKEYGRGGTYKNAAAEAPGRALPYFVPIHNEMLFGTAKFDGSQLSYSVLNRTYAEINGNGKCVTGLNIDSTKYTIPSNGEYYVSAGYLKNGKTTGGGQVVNYHLTGLFAYVNTKVSDLAVVNAKVKGMSFAGANNKNVATGTLAGAAGYDALFTNCYVYIDETGLSEYGANSGPKPYNADGNQNWYGVSGEGCVGGLVGYSVSHHVTDGYLTGNTEHLAFLRCFSAVPVSGNMRGQKVLGAAFANGVGGLVGVTKASNFYACYASGDVLADGVYTEKSTSIIWSTIDLDGSVSIGAGGLVGTSHGGKYSNCFTTGDVTADATTGVGSFLGVMCYNVSFTSNAKTYKQLSLLESCYTTGNINGKLGSAFTGGNSSNGLNNQVVPTDKMYTDYYQMIAPYYYEIRQIDDNQNRDYMTKIEFPTEPDGYKSGSVTYYYLSKDCYYLDMDADEHITTNRTGIGAAVNYDILMNLVSSFSGGSNWVEDQWDTILEWTTDDGKTFYDAYYHFKIFQLDEYFHALEGAYIEKLEEAFSDEVWWDQDDHKKEYNFPLIKNLESDLEGMEYYGDWPTLPLTHGLAYYEYYSHDPNTIHVQFDRADTGDLLTNEELRALGSHVISDGYAVVLKDKPTKNLSVKVGTVSANLSYSGAKAWNYNGKTVYLLLLTGTQMHTNAPAYLNTHKNDTLAKNQYYVPVTFTLPWKVNNQSRSCTVYFNPFTANSQINPSMIDRNDFNIPDFDKVTVPGLLEIRTARQLGGLMDYRAYALSAEGFNYFQTIDMDASGYTCSSYTTGKTAVQNALKGNSIAISNSGGTAIVKFQGTYTGAGTGDDRPVIANFFANRKYLGLFLNIGNNGAVSNLILKVDGGLTKDVSAKTNAAAGLLADVNEGTIKNVDVVLAGTVSIKGKTNAGLLVGKALSTSVIENCNVTATGDVSITVTATTTDASAGGMVGNLAGTVKGGSVNFSGTLTTAAPNCGGFAGLATNAKVEGVTVNAKKLASGNSGAKLGGLVGNMVDGKYTDVDVTISGGSATFTAMGGMAGVADKAVITDSSVTVGDMIAGTVGGLAHTGNGISINNCTVTVNGTLEGSTAAAGMVANASGTTSSSNAAVVVKGNIKSSNHAAGFAVTQTGEWKKCTVTLDGGTISGGEVAGFAHTVSGQIKDNSAVVGTGTITGTKAAGFAVSVTGSVAESRVTPAIAQTSEGYLGGTNENLVVTGSSTAAGFVATVNSGAKVSNCDALCKVSVGAYSSAFVDTNSGTIDGCIVNVAISGGYAFARNNNGTVQNSYGWYGDGSTSSTTTVPGSSTKNYYSCYFGDIDASQTSSSVAIFDSVGKYAQITPVTLTTSLNTLSKNSAEKWFDPGTYDAYSYGMSGGYPYPMLREHCGDWAGTQTYAANALQANISGAYEDADSLTGYTICGEREEIVTTLSAMMDITQGLVEPTRKECILL